jgi:hypothetical protein
MAIFEFLRLSLGKPDQGALFSDDGGPTREISRREYLERIFSSRRIDFAYYGGHYTFSIYDMEGETLVGRIGKKAIGRVRGGPDQDFLAEMVEDWKTAWVFLDLSSKSQLLAVQTGVAATKELVAALFRTLEERNPAHEYVAFVEYVSRRSDFWAVANQYRGKLTRLEFTFVPPNALGLEEEIRSIVDAAKAVGSEKTKFIHTNSHGALYPHGDYVEAALKTTTDGAGSVEMRAGKKVVFSSSKNRKTVAVDGNDVPDQNDETMISRLKKVLFGEPE